MVNRLQRVFAALSDNRVDFVLCGGVACVLQSCERTTQDLDIYVALKKTNLLRTVESFRDLGFRPRVPEPMEALAEEKQRNRWRQEKGALVYTLVSPEGIFQIDIFLTYPIPRQQLRENADTVLIGGKPIHPDFDGHLEYSLRDKTPDEKIVWLEMMMELQGELWAIARRSQDGSRNTERTAGNDG